MTRHLLLLVSLLALALALASSCTGGQCEIAVVECGCPGGARGAQFCQPDGSLGRCECPGVELETSGSGTDTGDEFTPAPAGSPPTRAARPGHARRQRADLPTPRR